MNEAIHYDEMQKMMDRGEKDLLYEDADRQIDIMRIHEKLDKLKLENDKLKSKNHTVEIKI